MTLLVVLGAWFAAGVVATLLLGPHLRRAAEEAGPVLEPDPVFAADRSPLRWRLGTLGVVGLLAGSTGMAAAGALPGSAQTIAHRVLGTVGVDVPESSDAPARVATGPAATPWSDVGPSTSSPGTSAAPSAPEDADPAPAPSVDTGEAGGSGGGAGRGGADSSDVASTPGSRGGADPAPPATSEGEPSDVDGDTGGEAGGEPSDVPEDPPAEEPPPPTTTTTTPPPEEPPPTTTTTTTPPGVPTTTTTLPPPPPPVEPAG